MNGLKFAFFITGSVSAMNAVSATTLIATSTALKRALSVVPMMSNAVTNNDNYRSRYVDEAALEGADRQPLRDDYETTSG